MTGTAGLVRASLWGLVLLAGCLGGAALLPIDGAVMASGQILVEGKAQPVQSLDPGLVAEVRVHNGDVVRAGDVVLTLDPTLPRTRRDIAMERLATALAEEARLTAEAGALEAPRFALPALPFPAPAIAAAAARQQALFDTRRQQRAEARQRLGESDAQLGAQIDGLAAQIRAGTAELALLREDLARQATLVEGGLARQSPLNELQRQEATLVGRIAALEADRLRLEGARREARLALAQEESRRDEEVALGLRDTSTQIQELKAEILSLNEALARTELRAPSDGIVHELQVPAPGSVIAAGAVLAQIVPTDRAMELEVMVNPRDIDSVHPGQSARVTLSAFDPRSLPPLTATVSNVPPGTTTDAQTGHSFYRVTLHLDPLATGDAPPELRAGMPVQVFLQTGERRLLSWLLAPVLKPMAGALREG